MFNISVLISGGGSNLQALIDAVEAGELSARINLVAADRPAPGLARAESRGIPTLQLDRKAGPAALNQALLENIPTATDLIVLAGYLSILSEPLLARWAGRVVNIHPSLLPDFGGKGMYGLRVHRAVIEAGRRESGCTVHLVDRGVDTGRILRQRRVAVAPGESPESLQKKVLVQEHRLLVESIEDIIKNKRRNRRFT